MMPKTLFCLLALSSLLAASIAGAQAVNAVQTNTSAAPMAADADPSFEVATIKPPSSPGFFILNVQGEHYAAHNVTLQDLVKFAYSVQVNQIENLPKFANENRYDIAALMSPEGRPNGDQLRTMLRKLLTERWKLAFHTEQRTLSVYALTAPHGAEKLKPSTTLYPADTEREAPGGMEFAFRGVNTKSYANYLQQALLDRPVVDQTGLADKGKFDFDIVFMPDDSMFGGRFHASPDVMEKAAPGFFNALTETTGLKLVPEKVPVDVLVIDHAEAPSAN
jgi:uncharacterized protein (TIGR03435 family)